MRLQYSRTGVSDDWHSPWADGEVETPIDGLGSIVGFYVPLIEDAKEPSFWRALYFQASGSVSFHRIVAMFATSDSANLAEQRLYFRTLTISETPSDPPPAAGGVILAHRRLTVGRGDAGANAFDFSASGAGPGAVSEHNVALMTRAIKQDIVFPTADWKVVLKANREETGAGLRLRLTVYILRDVAGDWQVASTFRADAQIGGADLATSTVQTIRETFNVAGFTLLEDDRIAVHLGVSGTRAFAFPAGLIAKCWVDGLADVVSADGTEDLQQDTATCLVIPHRLIFK
jgi:hypothetical protein